VSTGKTPAVDVFTALNVAVMASMAAIAHECIYALLPPLRGVSPRKVNARETSISKYIVIAIEISIASASPPPQVY